MQPLHNSYVSVLTYCVALEIRKWEESFFISRPKIEGLQYERKLIYFIWFRQSPQSIKYF